MLAWLRVRLRRTQDDRIQPMRWLGRMASRFLERGKKEVRFDVHGWSGISYLVRKEG